MSIPECGKEFIVGNCPSIDGVAPSADGSGRGHSAHCSGELLVLETGTREEQEGERRGVLLS